MKKRFFLLPLLTAIWLILMLACNGYKDPPPDTYPIDHCPFPEITTDGLGTFGCKIEGLEWVPCVDPWSAFTLRPIECRAGLVGYKNFIQISLHRFVIDSLWSSLGQNKFFSLSIDTLEIGKYDIAHNADKIAIHLSESGSNGKVYEEFDLNGLNYIDIVKISKKDKVVSGVFQFTLIEKNTGDKINLSDGRFDLKYIDP